MGELIVDGVERGRGGVFSPETFTLGNGLEVVVVSNHRAPVVTHWLWYKVGTADSPPGKSGLPHFLEHLMFKGTAAIPPGEFSKIVARHGGDDNAMTSHDFTAYHQTIAKDRLPLVMAMEADRMRNLALVDEIVYPERDVIIEERRLRVDNEPAALLSEALSTLQYQHYPYRLPVIGWMHEIEGYTREDALAFYDAWYAPNNAVLIVAGDVTAAELRPLAEAHYGPIESRAVPARSRVQEPPQHAERVVELRDERVHQPSLIRCYLAPSRRSTSLERVHALGVLAELLGGGATSRLYRSLVVERGLAVSAGAYYSGTSIGDTPLRFYVSPRSGTPLDALEAALDEELLRLLREPPAEGEVALVKQRMQAEAIYARDSLGAPAHAFGVTLTTGGSIGDVEDWPAGNAAVTPESVLEVAQDVLVRKRSVTGRLLGPKP